MTDDPPVESNDVGEGLDAYAERILDAARERLIDYGLRRTSLDDIAGHAGVGRATLYRRFPNRDTLLAAVIMREARSLIARVDAQLDADTSAEQHLIAGFLAFVRELRANELLQRLMVSDPEQLLPLLTGNETLAMGRAYILAQNARAEAEGAELTSPPEYLAELLARFAQSLALTRDSVLPLDDEAALAQFAHATLRPLVFR